MLVWHFESQHRLGLEELDVSATHLYTPGIRARMRNALRHGATAGEMMEALEIVSVTGIHGALIAAPMLEENLRAREDAGR